ncbi:hypothetical protein AAFN88_05080 [Pelagibius sp. CAU 1746]|uniref:hypothetical protein n=1 Tax=Pelagibius sp. CAU 1746 TaxID=3140370 RepID=UPI00325BD2E4
MAEPQPDATTPGRIPCPDCGQALALPIAAVLSGQPIVCAACGLELQAKREDSAEALAALGRWYEETATARAAAAGARSSPPKSSGRRR